MGEVGVPEESELREERQFDLMRGRLARFRRGDVGPRTLIDDLYGLLDQLEITDRAWVMRFRDRVDNIEMVHAAALDSYGPGALPDD